MTGRATPGRERRRPAAARGRRWTGGRGAFPSGRHSSGVITIGSVTSDG